MHLWIVKRFRHFADWSTNSAEYNILREVEKGFMDTFLGDIIDEKLGGMFDFRCCSNDLHCLLSRFSGE